MAFRRISHEDRVNAVKECIEIKNVKGVAKKYGISEATLKEDCNDILKETDGILKKENWQENKRESQKDYAEGCSHKWM